MAKKKGDEEEGKKKKPIVPIVLLVGGLFAGKTFFGGGGAEKTAAELQAEEDAAHAELVKACEESNGMAEGSGDASHGSDSGHSTESSHSTEETGTEETTDGHSGESLELSNLAFVAATRPAQGGGGGAAVPSTLELDSVTVNLADGHYLKLGLALQLKEGITAEAAEKEGLGAKALDMALSVLSAKEMPELIAAEDRTAIKTQLGFDTCVAYHGDVTTVYFTEFVMQ
jgi:flagellar basal body-associated protein FliL